LGVHRSTIYRELKRNKPDKKYRASGAQRLARERHRYKPKRTIPEKTLDRAVSLLRLEFSPEQISNRFKLEGQPGVSHETIYRYVFADKLNGGDLYTHLRRRHKYRKPRHVAKKHRKHGCFTHPRTPICKRPLVVDERSRFGDWELDTIIGAKQKKAIITLVERKSRFCLLKKVDSKSAHLVADAVIRMLSPFKNLVHTITSDNGLEFAQHKLIADSLNADYFFADPYSSWQRGTNENTNGLVRQYIPKKSHLSLFDNDFIYRVNYRLNLRPRKALGFRNPSESLFNFSVAFMT
jgi:IS30 family transposase